MFELGHFYGRLIFVSVGIFSASGVLHRRFEPARVAYPHEQADSHLNLVAARLLCFSMRPFNQTIGLGEK